MNGRPSPPPPLQYYPDQRRQIDQADQRRQVDQVDQQGDHLPETTSNNNRSHQDNDTVDLDLDTTDYEVGEDIGGDIERDSVDSEEYLKHNGNPFRRVFCKMKDRPSPPSRVMQKQNLQPESSHNVLPQGHQGEDEGRHRHKPQQQPQPPPHHQNRQGQGHREVPAIALTTNDLSMPRRANKSNATRKDDNLRASSGNLATSNSNLATGSRNLATSGNLATSTLALRNSRYFSKNNLIIEPQHPHRSAVTHLLCGIYALVIVVLGFVLPTSNVITHHPGDHVYYVEVFHLYIYMTSLIFLSYLHVYLLRQKNTSNDDVTTSSRHHSNNPRDCGTRSPASTRSIQLLSNNQLHAGGGGGTLGRRGSNGEKPSYIRELEGNLQQQADNTNTNTIGSKTSDYPARTDSPTGISDTCMPPDVDESTVMPAISYAADGVNFYLRLGAIVFGTGSMIHDGFKIAQVFEGPVITLQCYGPLYILVVIMHIMFTFFQTYFLFKSHAVVFNIHKAFVRFGLVHVAATNLCVWAFTSIIETSDEMRLIHDNPSSDPVDTAVGDLDNRSTTTQMPLSGFPAHDSSDDSRSTIMSYCYQSETLAQHASPFLYPCTIQYSLIGAAVLYNMYCSVGRVTRHIITPAAVGAGGGAGTVTVLDDNVTVLSDAHDHTSADCSKANKGLFLGLFITILTLIAISCFFVFGAKPEGGPRVASLIFYTTEIALLFISCTLVCFGFFKLRQLRFVSQAERNTSLDDRLLIVSLFGLFTFNAFLIVSSVANIDEAGITGILSLVSAVLAFIQAAKQTVFILDALRRRALTERQARRKPGRTLVTFLLLCNLSLFVVNIFEVKKTEAVDLHLRYYGSLPWSILSHVCVPLLIFFRFHSTVCLSDIWAHAYYIRASDA